MAASLSSSSSQSTTLQSQNKSTVTVSATVTINVGDFQGMQSYGYISINGTEYTILGPTLMAALSSPVVGPHQWTFDKSVNIDHGTNGYRGAVACSARFSVPAAVNPNTGNEYHYCTSDTPDQPAIDYVRLPTGSSFASGPSRNVRAVDLTLNAVTNYGSTLNYYVDYSENGGGYTGVKVSAGRSFSFPNLNLGSSYVFRGYAADTEGTGASVISGAVPIPNLPSAPSTCTTSTVSGRELTVTSGSSLANGAAITGYRAQQSPDNGVTWQNAAGTVGGSDLMTSQAITYSNLVGGATYKFRVFATNEMGSGATTTSSSVFVPSGGKRYDGTTFVNASKANRRNETNTAWVPIATTKKYVVSGAITNAVGNGSSVTYTASNAFTASPGNKVTVTGVTPSAYNVVNAVVTAATSTTFTVTSPATGTYSSSPSSKAAGWMEFV